MDDLEALEQIARKHAVKRDYGDQQWELVLTHGRAIDALREAVAWQREECAKIAENKDLCLGKRGAKDCHETIAEAIRASGGGE